MNIENQTSTTNADYINQHIHTINQEQSNQSNMMQKETDNIAQEEIPNQLSVTSNTRNQIHQPTQIVNPSSVPKLNNHTQNNQQQRYQLVSKSTTMSISSAENGRNSRNRK